MPSARATPRSPLRATPRPGPQPSDRLSFPAPATQIGSSAYARLGIFTDLFLDAGAGIKTPESWRRENSRERRAAKTGGPPTKRPGCVMGRSSAASGPPALRPQAPAAAHLPVGATGTTPPAVAQSARAAAVSGGSPRSIDPLTSGRSFRPKRSAEKGSCLFER